MVEFLNGFKDYQTSLILLFSCLIATIFILQWIFWIFGWGRFAASSAGKSTPGPSVRSPIRYLIADLFVKVIDDFRHLLALLITVMFAISLLYSLWRADASVDGLAKALQAVTGSLGGIIGVILGYYFGESSARSADNSGLDPASAGAPKQQIPPAIPGPEPQEDAGVPQTAPRPPAG